MRGAGAGAALALALGVVLAACGGDLSSTPSAPPIAASAAPASTSTSSIDAATPASGSPASSAGASPATGVARDDSLLAILPPDLDGTPVTVEEGSFATAAADPAFAANVASAAFAVIVDGSDLASGVVAQLEPGVYTDAFFRDWRETYNTGACGQAGGVVGNAEAEIDGRTVYITTCGGGLRVYHTYLEARGVVVSLFSVGDKRFGERLMSDLRP